LRLMDELASHAGAVARQSSASSWPNALPIFAQYAKLKSIEQRT